MEPSKLGQLWGVGVGPGDPELITLKAARLLKTRPVVAFPAGRNNQPGMAQNIVAAWLQPDQVQLPLYFPYVQDATLLEAAWKTAADQVWPYLARGEDVVFATEGDASFYSTFTYLAQTLQHHHPEVVVHTVPGVCSPLAAAAILGEPLALQAQRLTVLPALYTLTDLDVALDHADVVVLMKVATVYPTVWKILQRRQLLHRSRVIVRASQFNQEIYRTLENYPTLQLPYFSLLITHCGQSIR
ncbi:MAG: precorrin-2 C(20)-methyltransferase [Leptolyngbya sp. SIO1E4]|nr:precorrin-2 C(20)-methyltransferase [Leptolyngbya sp. SIO1E4]